MYEEKYLKLLGIQMEPPSVSFLAAIVKRHLAMVPYENISKIIRFHEVEPSIPSLAEFVEGIAEKTYGGTCFAQNIYLNHILNYLGFKSKLIGIRKDANSTFIGLHFLVEELACGYCWLLIR